MRLSCFTRPAALTARPAIFSKTKRQPLADAQHHAQRQGVEPDLPVRHVGRGRLLRRPALDPAVAVDAAPAARLELRHQHVGGRQVLHHPLVRTQLRQRATATRAQLTPTLVTRQRHVDDLVDLRRHRPQRRHMARLAAGRLARLLLRDVGLDPRRGRHGRRAVRLRVVGAVRGLQFGDPLAGTRQFRLELANLGLGQVRPLVRLAQLLPCRVAVQQQVTLALLPRRLTLRPGQRREEGFLERATSHRARNVPTPGRSRESNSPGKSADIQSTGGRGR
jgi:hypothetical protein